MRKRLLAALADDSGTGLTEFAFAFVVYVLVTLGTIQVALWAFAAAAGQFAVWEGCRAGAAAYQPPPPDATDDVALRAYHESSAEYAANAAFAAADRTESILSWLPITSEYTSLEAVVEEEDVLPGEEGRRAIVTSVRVRPFVIVPFFEQFLDDSSGEGFGFDRACRLRLGRFYSF
jgi:hypothetical protein